jgi:hypothetical protein
MYFQNQIIIKMKLIILEINDKNEIYNIIKFIIEKEINNKM